MNQFWKRFLQGLLLGFALITAIGGGTMAVLIGVYDDLIIAVSDFRKNPKKSLSLLVPMAIGGLISMGILFYPIKLLLEHFPFITISFFVGLTMGGLRVFHKTLKGSVTWQNLLLTLFGFLFVFALGAFTWFTTLSADLVNINVVQLILFFLIAFVSMGAHVSPGLSGTFILIAFGYYEQLIDFMFRIVKLDFVHVGYDLSAVFLFALGSLLGLIIIAKIYKYFFNKNRAKTYFTILGFIIGSITIAYFNGKIKPEYAKLGSFDPVILILSIVAIVVGFVISYTLLGLSDRKKEATNEEEVEEDKEEINNVGI